jgi:hypothetical protein
MPLISAEFFPGCAARQLGGSAPIAVNNVVGNDA